jgi:RES domain-containing protein
VLYTALSEHGACKELERLANRQHISLEDLLPRTLCILRVRLGSVLDLASEANLSLVGLSLPDVTGEEMTACQQVGEAAHRLGFEGLLVPSATSAGRNLVVFPLNVAPNSHIDEESTVVWATLRDLPGRVE